MPRLVDVRSAGVDVIPSVAELTITPEKGSGLPFDDTITISLPGAAAISREAAKIDGNRFSIATQFIAMNHDADTPLGPVRLTLAPDVLPKGEITGRWDRERNEPVFPARSVFFEVATQLETDAGTFNIEAGNVTAQITCVPPVEPDEYTHEDQLRILRAGQLVGKVLALHKIRFPPIVKPPPKEAPLPARHCCPPPQTLTTEGCLGCIDLDRVKGFNRQIIFYAPKDLSDYDKTLVYVQITNNGPAAMNVFVGRPDPGVPIPALIILPGQTSTFAAQEQVVVAIRNVPPLSTKHASGFYVLSRCCPTQLGINKPKPQAQAPEAGE